jgi:hypothetical protein
MANFSDLIKQQIKVTNAVNNDEAISKEQLIEEVKYDFDSDWFSVDASKNYDVSHNLGTEAIHITTMYRTSSDDKPFYNCDNLQGMCQAGDNSSDSNKFNGMNLEYKDDNTISLNTANNYVFASDNTIQYGGSQYSGGNNASSGEVRLLIRRVL